MVKNTTPIIIFYDSTYSEIYHDYIKLKYNFSAHLFSIGEIEFPDQENIIKINSNVIFSSNEIEKIEETIMNITKEWYKNNGIDYTIFNNVSFGEFLEYELQKIITTIVKYISILNKIKPNKIIYCHDNSFISNVIYTYSLSNSIDLENLLPENIDINNTNKYIWRNQYDNSFSFKIFLKYIVSSFKKIFENISNKDGIYIEYHNYTKSFLTYLIKSEFEKNIYSNTSNYKFLLNKNYNSLIGANRILNFKTKIFYNKLLKKIKEDTKNCNLNYLNGVDIFELVYLNFYDNLYSALSFFISNTKYYNLFLEKYKINTIVIMQDSIGVNKILQLLSNRKNIKSFYFLHGVPCYTETLSFPKINTKYIISCSKIHTDILKNTYNNVVTLINKEIFKINCTNQIINSKISNFTKKVLILSEPITNYVFNEEYYIGNNILINYLDLAKKNDDILFIIRFHPSIEFYENLNTKIKILEKYKLSNIIIDINFNLSDVLNSVDVVIGTSSTVCLSALLVQKLFICYDPFKKDPAKYIFYNAGYGVYNEFELEEALIKAFDDKFFIESVQNNSKKYIQNSFSDSSDSNFEISLSTLLINL